MDNETLSLNLLNLAKEHKRKCNGDCCVSLFLIGQVYQKLIKRNLTKKERLIFI